MPTPDSIYYAGRRGLTKAQARIVRLVKGRRRRKDGDKGGVPVEPNRPNSLSGGAAAALEFDD